MREYYANKVDPSELTTLKNQLYEKSALVDSLYREIQSIKENMDTPVFVSVSDIYTGLGKTEEDRIEKMLEYKRLYNIILTN